MTSWVTSIERRIAPRAPGLQFTVKKRIRLYRIFFLYCQVQCAQRDRYCEAVKITARPFPAIRAKKSRSISKYSQTYSNPSSPYSVHVPSQYL